MKLFGLTITTSKAEAKKKLLAEPSRGWRSIIREAFTGAWQRNIVETHDEVISYPTLYACLARISKDIGKLTFQLKTLGANGIWSLTESPAYSPVLRKPNHYQTQAQFRETWILSKLMQGNTYVMKVRDERNVVIKMYVLDPCRVKPLVSDSGDVFYELQTDRTNLIGDAKESENVIVPAREIIHDREIALHHPLIGVPPLCAAYWPAVKNLQILRSASDFFANGAQPSGILVAPGAISDEIATALKESWDTGFTGANAGRIAVLSDGLKFEPMSAKSVDSQMVEQLRYSDEQICQPFGIPPFKIGIGAMPAGLKVDDLNNLYYADALQDRIEHMEALIDEGFQLDMKTAIEMDLEPLLRMDQEKRATVETLLVGGKLKTPDEGRKSFGLSPTGGGDTLWGQHQDYPLGMLRDRNDLNPPAPTAPVAEDEVEDAEESAEALERMFA